MSQMSSFAKHIMETKYSHVKSDGTLETWGEIAGRVAENVMGAVNAPKELIDAIQKVIAEKKFIPGGRYLYAAGRPYHGVNNCLCLSVEDSREGWAELLRKSSMALMTGAGIGVNYSRVRAEGEPIMKTGGTATGPLALMQMVNEVSRGVMQGGSRRSAVLAILSWKHPDIYKYIAMKNWPDYVREHKGKDVNFPATMDGTNISVQLDDEFFEAFHNTSHTLHSHASSVYWAVIEQMLKTGEPGFTVDVGENHWETLRNAPVSADTKVLTINGYVKVGDIVGVPVIIWTGSRWVGSVVFERTFDNAPIVKITLDNGRFIKCEPNHEFVLNRGWPRGLERVKARHLESGDVCFTGILSDEVPDGGKVVTAVGNIEYLEEREGVYCCNVGVEEHSFMAEGVIISNCGEITSDSDSDICNLGSINMARINSPEEMETVVDLGTALLLAGTVYSDVPYGEVRNTRDKNRRLGLGLMGLHEWLLKRGKTYGPDEELEKYLKIYAGNKEIAWKYADAWGLSRPVKTRAIAPTGTTGIVAETTTGIEPVFCVAYKRRYRKGATLVEYQYVIDPTAKRLVESGINPDVIEDAYTLAENVEKRIAFQVWIQRYVDHGVSSCLAAGHSMVQTDKGLFEIEELAARAAVKQFAPTRFKLHSVNKDGRKVSVDAVYNNGEAEVLSMECGGGYEVRCTPNHKVVVLDKNYDLSWIAAGDVAVGDYLVGRKGLNLFPVFTTKRKILSRLVGSKFSYKKKTNAKDIKLPERMSPALARLLGYMCSDGSVGKNGIGLTQQENNVLLHFQEIVEELFGVVVAIREDKRSNGLCTATANSRQVRDFMLWLGITDHDTIEVPLCIRKSGRNCVLEFIRGVTLDGHVGANSVCVATSISKKYLQQLQMMLINAGVKASVLKSSDAGERLFPNGKKYKTKQSWRLIISDSRDIERFSSAIGFAEDRKNQELSGKYKRTGRIKVLGDVPDYGLRERFLKEMLPCVKSNKLYTHFRSMVCNSRHGMGLDRESVLEMSDIGMSVPPYVIDETYMFHKVKSIKNFGITQTYDLSVPDGNSYIANGFICHNTINIPAWGTEFNNHDKVMDFGNMLIKYLPQLRGITAYPDGARAGQPLTPVKFHTAAKHVGQVFVETVDVCDLKGGSCGG